MDIDKNILPENIELVDSATLPEQDTSHPVEQEPESEQQELKPNLGAIVDAMGLSENLSTSAKAILEPIEKGAVPGESLVKLIVSALTHDEDLKNAEAAGYLRGRNEVIDAATKACDGQEPQALNFPIYRKRSFWD